MDTMTEPHAGFDTAAAARLFALAGHAHLTLTSEATGTHYTYRIRRWKDFETGEPTEPATWSVYLLRDGNADDGAFTYMGLIDAAGRFKTTAKSGVGPGAESMKAWRYFWSHLLAGHIAPSLRVQHEGHCGRCGRTLTEPESIDAGFGPICREKLGLAA